MRVDATSAISTLAMVIVVGRVPPCSAQAGVLPVPEVHSVSYGPHGHDNVLDLFQAKSPKPTPLVIYIHGGGFAAGSKSWLPLPLLNALLHRGISVATINYRLTDSAPFPAAMIDGARAIQFLRSRALEWNLDPKRFGAMGGSAGAGMSLWIGFHDDMADPRNPDPVLRQSTRLQVVAATNGQSSYDPRWILHHIGVRVVEHPFFKPFYGLADSELDSPKAYRLYDAASPMTYLSPDDPPVFLYYDVVPRAPLAPDADPNLAMHHIIFGNLLKVRMDSLHIDCVVRHLDDYTSAGRTPETATQALVDFLASHLGLARNAVH